MSECRKRSVRSVNENVRVNVRMRMMSEIRGWKDDDEDVGGGRAEVVHMGIIIS